MTDHEILELLLKKISGMEEDISGIEEHISGMEEDISGIEEHISGMEEDISGIKPKLDKMDERLIRVETKLDHTMAEVASLRQDVNGLQNEKFEIKRIK